LTALAGALLLLMIAVGGLIGFAAYTARRVEIAVPPQGRLLDLDGERVHYLDKGAGPALFLIHGLSGQMGNFAYALVDLLAREFRVVAVDRPGSGYSTRPADADASLRAQARALAKVIRALDLDRPLIVGHSMGGAIALAIALDNPELVSGLALIAPLTQVVKTPPEPFRGLVIRSRLVRSIVAWTLATPLTMLTADRVLKQLFAPEKAPPDFTTAGGALLGLRPCTFYAASSDLLAVNNGFAEMIRRYPSLSVPVGILFGRGDRLLDYRLHGQAMKEKIPNLHLEVVEGGHMLPITAPDLVADFIRRMAARRRAPPRAPQAGALDGDEPAVM
jgi:pimeloyl-ACP methyl ester carboxylesterase